MDNKLMDTFLDYFAATGVSGLFALMFIVRRAKKKAKLILMGAVFFLILLIYAGAMPEVLTTAKLLSTKLGGFRTQ